MVDFHEFCVFVFCCDCCKIHVRKRRLNTLILCADNIFVIMDVFKVKCLLSIFEKKNH